MCYTCFSRLLAVDSIDYMQLLSAWNVESTVEDYRREITGPKPLAAHSLKQNKSQEPRETRSKLDSAWPRAETREILLSRESLKRVFRTQFKRWRSREQQGRTSLERGQAQSIRANKQWLEGPQSRRKPLPWQTITNRHDSKIQGSARPAVVITWWGQVHQSPWHPVGAR